MAHRQSQKKGGREDVLRLGYFGLEAQESCPAPIISPAVPLSIATQALRYNEPGLSQATVDLLPSLVWQTVFVWRNQAQTPNYGKLSWNLEATFACSHLVKSQQKMFIALH